MKTPAFPPASLDASAALPRSGFVRRSLPGSAPVWMLHAGAGWGKSVLLAQLAEEWAPAVYLALDGEDNRADILDAHLRAAIRFSLGEIGDDCAPAEALTERGAALLIDNAGCIDSPEAAGTLSRLISLTAGRIRIALAGRRIPGFLLPRLLDGSCLEITARELRFTEEESGALIPLLLAPDSPVLRADDGSALPQAARELHSFCGGFPAAEAMLLREIALCRERELNLVSAAERSHLQAYIGAVILPELEEDMISFVRRTAFLPGGDDALCRAVLDERCPGEKTAALIRDGILVSPDTDSRYPSYPPAIRQALAGMLPGEERTRLCGAAVSHFVASGQIAQALTLLNETGDAAAVEAILLRCGERLLANREFELIGYCAEIMDRCGTPSDPAVLGTLAQYAYYRGDIPGMEQLLNTADSAFGRENRYSAWRGLYGGLLKYDKNPALYRENILRFTRFLREHAHPLPFLHPKEEALLSEVLAGNGTGAELPLRMRRFGSFTLTLTETGTELPWRTKKACEFVAYMAERGGKPIERDRLLNVLWQDGMPESAVAMLHNIIYSLRRELHGRGADGLITYKDKCYAMDMSLIADDSTEILAACRAAEAKDLPALRRHEKQFSDYWGKYLANLDCRWAADLQEHYDRCFIEGCQLLAEEAHAGGDFRRELSLLKNAARLDPYSEKIVREIIYCHIACGSPDKAKTCYEEYCALIDEELGIEPSKWLKREFLACFSENRT